MSKLFKATAYVAVINLFGLALNFFLNLILASKFGVGREMDCYLAATAIPSYIMVILTGSLSVTFIPAFADKKKSEGRWLLMGSILTIGIIVGLILSGLLFVFSFRLIEFQSPGFSFEMLEYSAFLLRWFVIMLLLTIINEVFSGIFYAEGEYLIPMMNKIISPVVTIVIIYIMGSQLNALVIVLSNVAGLVIQTIILSTSFWKKGYRLFIGKKIFNQDIKSLLILMFPLLIGSVFYKVLPVFDKYFLSSMPSGSISIINYSQKLFLAATQVIGAALSMQVLSHMANLVAESNYPELRRNLNIMVRIILFVTIPVTGLFMTFSYEIIRLVYERGEFTSENTMVSAQNFKIYSIAIPAVALGTIISQGLYVLKDTWSPFVVGVIEVFVYVVICYALVSVIGIVTLPVAYVTYFYFSIIILGIILVGKTSFITLRELLITVVKCITLIGIEILILNFLLAGFVLSNFITVLIIALSFIVYFVSSYFLKFNEARFISDKILFEKNLF